jgi:outer membrane protein TolC
MEEIRATSNAPRNDLDAPLVGGRDFVKERLLLDLQTAQRSLTVAEQEAAREKKRWGVGVATQLELQQAESEVAQAQARLQLLSQMLELRRRALEGSVKADDLAPALRKLELGAELQQIEREIRVARVRLDEARRRMAVGQASDVDVKRAELQLAEQELALKRVQEQLTALGGAKK